MFRPSGSIVLPFWIKKASLALWMESRLEKIFSIGTLTHWLQAAIEGYDDPWPFFHFWHHHFWPKLTSSMFNFCSSRRSFQWCPDHSDRPTGAWDMHKNAQKVKRKTQTKICCHYTGLLHGESCPSRWRFPRSFLTASKPSRRSKQKEKKRRERKSQKKNGKNRKA